MSKTQATLAVVAAVAVVSTQPAHAQVTSYPDGSTVLSGSPSAMLASQELARANTNIVTVPPRGSDRSPIRKADIEQIIKKIRVKDGQVAGQRVVSTESVSAARRPKTLIPIPTVVILGNLFATEARQDSAYFVATIDQETRIVKYYVGYDDSAESLSYLSYISALSVAGVVSPMTSNPSIEGTEGCLRNYAGNTGMLIGRSCSVGGKILYELPEATMRTFAARFSTDPQTPMIITRFQKDDDNLDHFVMFPVEAAALLVVTDREVARETVR